MNRCVSRNIKHIPSKFHPGMITKTNFYDQIDIFIYLENSHTLNENETYYGNLQINIFRENKAAGS